jgi:hypothetical protein
MTVDASMFNAEQCQVTKALKLLEESLKDEMRKSTTGRVTLEVNLNQGGITSKQVLLVRSVK